MAILGWMILGGLLLSIYQRLFGIIKRLRVEKECLRTALAYGERFDKVYRQGLIEATWNIRDYQGAYSLIHWGELGI